MYGVNHVILIGPAISNPILKYNKDGKAVCKFELQTQEPVKLATGEWAKKQRKHNIISEEKLAEQCIDGVVRGATYLVQGSLDYSTDMYKRRVAIVRAKMIQPIQQAYYQPGNDGYGKRVVVTPENSPDTK